MASLTVIIFSFIFHLFCPVKGINKYTNYSLIKITPYNNQQLKILMKISNSDDVDIMKHSYGVNDTTDILLSPKVRKNLEAFVKSKRMGIKRVDHYGRYLETHVALTRNNDQYMPFKYNSYKAISERLKTLSKENSRYVKLKKLGNSYEGRVMSLIKISANHEAKNPIIFLDAGTHAREWAGIAFAMYIIDQLATAVKKNRHKAEELIGVDWYILPVVNPDGYEYTRSHPSKRLWRKSRSKTWKEGCFGADINRNYEFLWGYTGVSFDPCDLQTYAGKSAFSERETKLVAKVMKKYSKRIKLYMAIHCYGQYLVYPWGYTANNLPDGWKKLHRLAQVYSKAVVRSGGQPFSIMSGGQWYPTSGGSDDYAFAVMKIPYSYTLEVTKGHEFIFPEKLLKVALPQYYEGLKEIAKEIKKEFPKKG